jgi:NAD(P)-dependent dehydrogenase (short-subunit alcohol dehydrogenase family)
VLVALVLVCLPAGPAINGAGIAGKPAPVSEQPVSEWRKDFDVMLLGVALCMKYEIRAMLKRGAGIHREHLLDRRIGRGADDGALQRGQTRGNRGDEDRCP